jgi:hypothetical protein
LNLLRTAVVAVTCLAELASYRRLSAHGRTLPLVLAFHGRNGVNEVPTDYPGGASGEAAARVFWRETVNRNAGPPTVETDGRYTTDVYRDGVAEYRWTVNGDIGHFWPKDLGYKLWDDFLSRYRRQPDATLTGQREP